MFSNQDMILWQKHSYFRDVGIHMFVTQVFIFYFHVRNVSALFHPTLLEDAARRGVVQWKESNLRDLQSPLSGEKKVQALFFSRKKNTFGGELRLGRPSRQRRAPRAPWGLPTPDFGWTFGQRSVDVGYLP